MEHRSRARRLDRQMSISAPVQRLPLLSVIVPVHNRSRQLRACLEGLVRSTFPRQRFEIIVSDDGSTEAMEPIVTAFEDRLRISLVVHPNSGPAAARNRGAARAQGSYLAFLDSDCVPAPDWLTALASQLERTPDHLVAGAIANALPHNPFSTATQLIVSYATDFYRRRERGVRFFNSSNLVLPADRFRRLGGFDESYPLAAGEDYDLCHRWQQAGYGMTYCPDAVVYHAHSLTLVGFCRQHYAYGRGLLRCRQGIARRAQGRLQGEPLSYYVELLRFPLRQGQGDRRWLHMLLVALSQAATAAGVLREMVTDRWQTLTSRQAAPML